MCRETGDVEKFRRLGANDCNASRLSLARCDCRHGGILCAWTGRVVPVLLARTETVRLCVDGDDLSARASALRHWIPPAIAPAGVDGEKARVGVVGWVLYRSE